MFDIKGILNKIEKDCKWRLPTDLEVFMWFGTIFLIIGFALLGVWKFIEIAYWLFSKYWS